MSLCDDIVKSMKLPTKKTLEGHIYKLTLASLLVSVVFAILSVTLIASSSTADLTIGHMTRDELASKDGNVMLAPASELVATVELRYVLTAIFVVSAVSALLLATVLKKNYERTLKTGVSGWQWLLVGLAAALFLEFLYMLVGVTDIFMLKLGAGLVLATALLGWLSERENKMSGRPKWLAFAISLFTGGIAWLPIIASLAATSIYGGERFGWHVYALSAVLFVGFSAYALNQYLQLRKYKFWREYTFAERGYLVISVLVTLLVGVISVTALS